MCVCSQDELSGADIKAVCTEAGLLALRERRMRVTQVRGLAGLTECHRSYGLEILPARRIPFHTSRACDAQGDFKGHITILLVGLLTVGGLMIASECVCVRVRGVSAYRLTSARPRRRCCTRRRKACQRGCICRQLYTSGSMLVCVSGAWSAALLHGLDHDSCASSHF